MGDTSPLSTPKLAFFDVQLGVLPKVQFNLWTQNATKATFPWRVSISTWAFFRPSGKILCASQIGNMFPEFWHRLESTPFSTQRKYFLTVYNSFMFSMRSLIRSFCLCACPSIYLFICHLCIYRQSEKVFIIQQTNGFIHSHP